MKGVVVLEFFRSYKLVEAEDGYDLILFMDTNMNDVEFADEFNKIDRDNKTRLNNNIIEYIKEKFPDKKINMVKIMAGTVLLSSFLISSPLTARAADAATSSVTNTQTAYNYNIKVAINGSVQSYKASPFIFNNTTYVPMSEFGNSIGASVWWNNTSNTVGINKNDTMIAFVRGSSLARVNGVQVTMPPSIVLDGITYAPLRFISENLGYMVTLNSSTQTIDISSSKNTYTVVAGDSLWKISQKYNITVDSLKQANNLTSDLIIAGQTLIIPQGGNTTPAPAPAPSPINNTQWPSVTYIVQAGDTATSIAAKFGASAQDIMKFNYMDADDWFDAGDKIAISGYAPRVTSVTPGQSTAPAQKGAAVDWFLEGQYIIKRGDVFTVVDVDTGKQFKAKMIGGYNHADVEPLTTSDTTNMKALFGTWQWSPRAVVIYYNGMNIAASLSGMPHGVDTITNGVNGHFDLYMKNSTSHSSTTSTVYIQEHYNMVAKAAGQ